MTFPQCEHVLVSTEIAWANGFAFRSTIIIGSLAEDSKRTSDWKIPPPDYRYRKTNLPEEPRPIHSSGNHC